MKGRHVSRDIGYAIFGWLKLFSGVFGSTVFVFCLTKYATITNFDDWTKIIIFVGGSRNGQINLFHSQLYCESHLYSQT
jgi:hypothetical protein